MGKYIMTKRLTKLEKRIVNIGGSSLVQCQNIQGDLYYIPTWQHSTKLEKRLNQLTLSDIRKELQNAKD